MFKGKKFECKGSEDIQNDRIFTMIGKIIGIESSIMKREFNEKNPQKYSIGTVIGDYIILDSELTHKLINFNEISFDYNLNISRIYLTNDKDGNSKTFDESVIDSMYKIYNG